MSIFLTPANELRSGWKFAVYIVFFLLIWFATGLALSAFVARRTDDLIQDRLFILALNEIGLLVPSIGAMWLTVRFVDHRPFRTFGIGFLPRWRRELLIGLGIAAGMLALLVAGCYAFGYVRIHWTGGEVSVWILLATFSLLLLAAANEELMFRGFPLQVLVDGVGEWPAMIGMSVLFGLIHLGNPMPRFWERPTRLSLVFCFHWHMSGPGRCGCPTASTSPGMSVWGLCSGFLCPVSISLLYGQLVSAVATLSSEAITVPKEDCSPRSHSPLPL
jgi:membrane protease YdiL (CAAX protease family)